MIMDVKRLLPWRGTGFSKTIIIYLLLLPLFIYVGLRHFSSLSWTLFWRHVNRERSSVFQWFMVTVPFMYIVPGSPVEEVVRSMILLYHYNYGNIRLVSLYTYKVSLWSFILLSKDSIRWTRQNWTLYRNYRLTIKGEII